MGKLVTTDDLAEALNVSKATVRRLAAAGELPLLRVGKQLRYDLAEVKRVLEARGQRGARS
jgi:excisionase family DNA binding protein